MELKPGLEDKLENQLEGSINTSGWSFRRATTRKFQFSGS